MSVFSARDVSEPGAATDKVYEDLRMAIVYGDIAPVTHIKIDAVATRLGVSQTPVREALQQLEGDGLLTHTPGRGYRTTPMIDLDRLQSLFEFRLLVEPWAVRLAAVDRLTNPAVALDDELKTFEGVALLGGDIRQAVLSHDVCFHDTILAAAGNDVVRRTFRQIHCHLHVFRLYKVDTAGTLTIGEHRRIWSAIKACDPDAAEEAMTQHLMSSYRRSAQAFESSAPEIRAREAANSAVPRMVS